MGASLTVPFGLTTEYNENWVGRYQGIKTHIQAIDLGVAASYDVNEYLSFGASFFAQKMDVEFTTAVDFGTALYMGGGAPLGFRPGNADGFNRLKGDSIDYGFTLGVLASPNDRINIAATFRSKVKHDIDDGQSSFRIPSNAAALLDQVQPGVFVDGEGRATIPLSATASLSVSQRFGERWTVMADVTRTAWSELDVIHVDYYSGQPSTELGFHYRDTTSVSIGADYKVSDKLTVRAGVGYDQTPTTDEHRDVRVPDNSRKLIALGMSWTPSTKMEVNIGYLHIITSDPRVREISATGNTLVGTYDIGGEVLGGSLNYRF